MDATVFRKHAELEERHWWFLSRQNILFPVIRQIMEEHPGPIADVGCGTGGFAGAVAKSFSCYGIDSSEIAIAIAVEKYPETRFLLGNAADHLRDEEEPPALLLLLDVLEHIEDPKAFLTGILDTIPTGTQILVTVPACPFLWSEHDVSAQHCRRYTKTSLAETWDDLPLKINYASYFNTVLFTPILAARLLAKLRSGSVGDDKTDFYLPNPTINKLLTGLFSSERWLIGDTTAGWRQLPIGVSLLTRLTKT